MRGDIGEKLKKQTVVQGVAVSTPRRAATKATPSSQAHVKRPPQGKRTPPPTHLLSWLWYFVKWVVMLPLNLLFALAATPKPVLLLIIVYLLWPSAQESEAESQPSLLLQLPVFKQIGMLWHEVYTYLDASFIVVLKGGGVGNMLRSLGTCLNPESDCREMLSKSLQAFGIVKSFFTR